MAPVVLVAGPAAPHPRRCAPDTTPGAGSRWAGVGYAPLPRAPEPARRCRRRHASTGARSLACPHLRLRSPDRLVPPQHEPGGGRGGGAARRAAGGCRRAGCRGARAAQAAARPAHQEAGEGAVLGLHVCTACWPLALCRGTAAKGSAWTIPPAPSSAPCRRAQPPHASPTSLPLPCRPRSCCRCAPMTPRPRQPLMCCRDPVSVSSVP